MPFNGSGLFSRLFNWQDDDSNGIPISSERMDGEDDNLADGLSQCITKDGQTNPSANLPMNGFKHTGVANASARNQYAAAGQVQDDGFNYVATVGGTADAITLTPSPAITAYAAGQRFTFIAGANNTGATTVDISGLGTKNIRRDASTALSAGDIKQNRLHIIVYDGTQFQLFTSIGDFLRSNLGVNLTVGFSASSYDAGTKTTGTYTPDPLLGNIQHAVNGGAHTLAPPASVCTMIIEYTNNGSAGAITTSGFDVVDGAFNTTNGSVFQCNITKTNSKSYLSIVSLA